MVKFKNSTVDFVIKINHGEDRDGNLIFNEAKRSSKYSDLIAEALNTVPANGWKDVKEAGDRYLLVKKFEACNGSMNLEDAEVDIVKEVCAIGKFAWNMKLSQSFIDFGTYIDTLPEQKK